MIFEQLCLGGASCFAIVMVNDERVRESLEGARVIDGVECIEKLLELVCEVLRN